MTVTDERVENSAGGTASFSGLPRPVVPTKPCVRGCVVDVATGGFAEVA